MILNAENPILGLQML